jgi:hypothetical protein
MFGRHAEYIYLNKRLYKVRSGLYDCGHIFCLLLETWQSAHVSTVVRTIACRRHPTFCMVMTLNMIFSSSLARLCITQLYLLL